MILSEIFHAKRDQIKAPEIPGDIIPHDYTVISYENDPQQITASLKHAHYGYSFDVNPTDYWCVMNEHTGNLCVVVRGYVDSGVFWCEWSNLHTISRPSLYVEIQGFFLRIYSLDKNEIQVSTITHPSKKYDLYSEIHDAGFKISTYLFQVDDINAPLPLDLTTSEIRTHVSHIKEDGVRNLINLRSPKIQFSLKEIYAEEMKEILESNISDLEAYDKIMRLIDQ